MHLLNEKFDRLIEIIGEHHIYTGPKKGLYGRFNIGGERVLAHVFALKRIGVVVPHGSIVCHHCDVPPCVNPYHLYVGDRSSNAKDFWDRLVTDEYIRNLRDANKNYWRTH